MSAVRMSLSDLIKNVRLPLATRVSLQAIRDNPQEKKKRGQKYGNTKVADGSLVFDSKAEHRRWVYLCALAKAREIRDLQRQVEFELIPAQRRANGKAERPTRYIADFVYVDADGRKVVEDVKGAVTPEFRLKRKLMLQVHGIEVKEVRS